MKNLIVCSFPSTEITFFGGLILSNPKINFDIISVFNHPLFSDNEKLLAVFSRSCNLLGVKKFQLLNYSYFPDAKVDLTLIISDLGSLSQYDRVYTHNVQSKNKLFQITSAAVGAVRELVWITAAGGIVDEIVKCDVEQFSQRINIINQLYSDLLRLDLITVTDIRNTDLFQKTTGANLYRYFTGYTDWRLNNLNFENPWGLATSKYEDNRYNIELSVLKEIQWNTLVEVGACEGTFTEKLCSAFPQKKIIAYEPDSNFFQRLQERIRTKAQALQGDCIKASQEFCDVFFVSSVIYYCKDFPYQIFDTKANYIITSHELRYHEETLNKVFLSKGYNCIIERNLDACLETMEGLFEIRYGTNVRVWSKMLK